MAERLEVRTHGVASGNGNGARTGTGQHHVPRLEPDVVCPIVRASQATEVTELPSTAAEVPVSTTSPLCWSDAPMPRTSTSASRTGLLPSTRRADEALSAIVSTMPIF